MKTWLGITLSSLIGDYFNLIDFVSNSLPSIADPLAMMDDPDLDDDDYRYSGGTNKALGVIFLIFICYIGIFFPLIGRFMASVMLITAIVFINKIINGKDHLTFWKGVGLIMYSVFDIYQLHLT